MGEHVVRRSGANSAYRFERIRGSPKGDLCEVLKTRSKSLSDRREQRVVSKRTLVKDFRDVP